MSVRSRIGISSSTLEADIDCMLAEKTKVNINIRIGPVISDVSSIFLYVLTGEYKTDKMFRIAA